MILIINLLPSWEDALLRPTLSLDVKRRERPSQVGSEILILIPLFSFCIKMDSLDCSLLD